MLDVIIETECKAVFIMKRNEFLVELNTCTIFYNNTSFSSLKSIRLLYTNVHNFLYSITYLE